MNNSPFSPRGPTVLVGLIPVQAPTTDNVPSSSYRVINLTANEVSNFVFFLPVIGPDFWDYELPDYYMQNPNWSRENG